MKPFYLTTTFLLCLLLTTPVFAADLGLNCTVKFTADGENEVEKQILEIKPGEEFMLDYPVYDRKKRKLTAYATITTLEDNGPEFLEIGYSNALRGHIGRPGLRSQDLSILIPNPKALVNKEPVNVTHLIYDLSIYFDVEGKSYRARYLNISCKVVE